jgi:hypothetical protein
MLNVTLKKYQSSVRLTKEKDETSTVRYTTERDEILKQNKETLKMLQEEAKEKIRLRTEQRVRELRVEKQEKWKHSLEKVLNEVTAKTKLRTEDRLAELQAQHLREEEEKKDRLFPS